jgi:Tol biopolymer transport system component
LTAAIPTNLQTVEEEDTPFWSPDGRWVYYTPIPVVGETGKSNIWKIPSEGGTAVQLTDKWSRMPVVSPDGKLIACAFREGEDSPWKTGILPTQGGAPVKLLAIPPAQEIASPKTPYPYPPFQWSRDGKSLVFVEKQNGVSNLWNRPLDGSPPKQLTHFQSDRIVSFAWSRDGKQLALARGTETSDCRLDPQFRVACDSYGT